MVGGDDKPTLGQHICGWDYRGRVVGVAVTATSDREVAPVRGSLAVYPGTFDPFTPGHRDLVARARVMFDRVIVLLAVNADKQPTAEATARAALVRDAMPAAWRNVEVDTWTGLTTAYCSRRSATVIVRGVRTAADLRYEYQLAAMNEQLGIQTVWLPARPQLAATSSTVARAYRSAQSARRPHNTEE
ncbi:pantetheine-phosphate adenylyltransferase [Micromonospora saelicesensis]|uniref:pantetheine-phosphate adenylyltransferase n=1 Tax=Micromonospora saelicesensis TaxID=285676 RepID=UPI000DC302FE|nr:pantetheine-phosphate adenylyltransferase [Micromonospora saelicesensis]RAO63100.1 Pantetheine-phosphate adenylyltransferase [Micromonospora saelicesensis]